MEETIIHNITNHQFEYEEQDVVAYISYSLTEGVMNLLSVQVPKALEGRGVAASLAQAALTYAQLNEYKVIATCPYVATYIERHPIYKVLLVE